MTVHYSVHPAFKCSRKDVINALDIYCKCVDYGSLTDTNQIKDYIWNRQAHVSEERQMFFYILYDENEVIGFSEFAYLPQNSALIIDYLCTKQRNHLLFYVFYQLTIQAITEDLKRKEQFIRYILTELSLSKFDGRLSDIDSNYFRHLLTNEGFVLLRYPYYQPPLLQHDEIREFNLAIKAALSDNTANFVFDSRQYLSIIRELYYSHYYAWFSNFPSGLGIREIIKQLPQRIEEEMSDNDEYLPISLVQCRLFDEGQCPQYIPENITVARTRGKRWKTIITGIIWGLIAGISLLVWLFSSPSSFFGIISSSLSFVSGIITIISFRKEFFASK